MEVLKGENRTCGGLFSQANPSGKLALSICNPSWHLLVALPRMDYLADHNPSPSFCCETWPRTDGSSSGLVDRCRWTNSCRHTGITRKRGAYKKDIYIYIYCNYVGGHPWAINRLEAIASSNKKATRWRPSLLGWTPSLLATRTVRHFTCAQLGFKVVAWDQL